MKSYMVHVHNGRRLVAHGEVGLYNPNDPAEVRNAASSVVRLRGYKRVEPGWKIKVIDVSGRRDRVVTEQVVV